MGGEGGLRGFEFGDGFFDGSEFVLEWLEHFVALFTNGRVAFAAFFGGELGLGVGGLRGTGLGWGRRRGDACATFFGFNLVEIVGEVAGEHSGVFLWAKFHRFLDDGVEEVPVVGNDEEGAGIVDEGFLQDVLRLHIEVVGRLVENEEIGRTDEHANEGHTGSLTATQDAYFFKDIVAFEKEAAEDITCGHGGATGLDLLDRFKDGEGRVEFVGVVLVKEGRFGFGSEFLIAG